MFEIESEDALSECCCCGGKERKGLGREERWEFIAVRRAGVIAIPEGRLLIQ
jgi:hypothetical protein